MSENPVSGIFNPKTYSEEFVTSLKLDIQSLQTRLREYETIPHNFAIAHSNHVIALPPITVEHLRLLIQQGKVINLSGDTLIETDFGPFDVGLKEVIESIQNDIKEDYKVIHMCSDLSYINEEYYINKLVWWWEQQQEVSVQVKIPVMGYITVNTRVKKRDVEDIDKINEALTEAETFNSEIKASEINSELKLANLTYWDVESDDGEETHIYGDTMTHVFPE